MSKYKVEKNIPIPAEKSGGRYAIYPFGEMDIGDSFYIETQSREKISTAASYYGKRNNKKYTVRKEKNGFRVWRIK